jgi:fatty-acyl-CoA synthase
VQQRPRYLIDRLDALEAAHGAAIAQSYVASGNPDDEPHELTFAQFAGSVRRRANALVAIGVSPTDVIGFAAPLSETSYPNMVAAMVAATYAPVNYFLETEALVRILKASGAGVLLVHRRFDDGAELLDKLRRVHAALPQLRLVSFGSGPMLEGAEDLETVAAGEPPSSWRTPTRGRAATRIVALLHTGGTTGLPKLVPHTEAMYDAVIDACGACEGTAPGESLIAGLPLFHTSGALQVGLVPLFNATRIVIPSSRGFRDPKVVPNYWRFVHRYSISIGAGVPTVLAGVAAIEPERPVTSIKHFIVGGAPISSTTLKKIRDITGGAAVIEGWGMTETCGFSVINPLRRVKTSSVGKPFPGVDVEIRKFATGDATGHACRTDEIGELVAHGNIVIKRYLDERPDAFTADGWLRTGDLGRRDADGYLWITGRVKDLIIRGGHNIDPAIIEEPAYQHAAVQLAAAVGKPDKYAGELPVLYVQLKPGMRATAQELEEFLRERIVERAAFPKAVIVVPEIPLSGPGKISKLTLRRQAISAVFQEEIECLALSGTAIEAAVVEDRLAGEVVLLRAVGAPLEADALRKVAAALSGFSIAHRWAEAEAFATNDT